MKIVVGDREKVADLGVEAAAGGVEDATNLAEKIGGRPNRRPRDVPTSCS